MSPRKIKRLFGHPLDGALSAPMHKKLKKYLEFSIFLLYISSGFLNYCLMHHLFYAEFERRLVALDQEILKIFIEGKEVNLFPMLYQVYAYIWTHGIDGCRLLSNPNKEKK